MFLRLWPTEKLLYIPIEAQQLETVASKFHLLRDSTVDTTQDTTSKRSFTMGLSEKSWAGPGYIILNVIRGLNIVALLAVITASVVMLVKTSVASKFFFFDAVTHVMTAITGTFLTVSELSLFRRYFARNWPLLSPSHGFVTLALAMLVLGVNMLGHLNEPAASRKSLGLAFWRLVISSGILVFVMGWLNLVASYVFRDHSRGITARHVRARGAVAATTYHKASPTSSSAASCSSAPALASSHLHRDAKPNSPFHFLAPRSPTLLPSYHQAARPAARSPPSAPTSPTSRYSRATACTRKKVCGLLGRSHHRNSLAPPLPVNAAARPLSMHISAPLNVNDQFAHLLQRPESALHPGRDGTGAWGGR